MERKAEAHYEFSEYDEALPLFQRLLDKDPSNAKYCYELGICYYYSSTSRPLSVPYFERALRLPGMKKTPDLYLHAGLAYLAVNRFADAKSCFEVFRSIADPSYDPTVALRMLNYCDNGLQSWKTPARVRIRNLGKNVNSSYPDYAPVLAKDDSRLLFTSKRPGTTGGRKDENGYFYEDIYQSKNLVSGKWGEAGRYDSNYIAPKIAGIRFFFARAENVSQLNTNDHDGSIAMAPDGNNLFIYRYGDIWQANVNGDHWEKPVRLHEEINAKSSVEPSMCLSADGNTMYFVSDRKGGMGGKDIWMSQKTKDGQWDKPENLGPGINTALDEESPFLVKNGNTLYFSSQGHNSMGGFDVFKSARGEDGGWMAPENLGAPINNGGDDIFYTPDESGNFAYYATLNRYGEGDLDLYSVMYYPEVQPMAKLRVPKTALPESSHLELSIKHNGELKTYSLNAGDSVTYPYTPGETAVLSITAPGYQKTVDTIQFKTSPYNYCLQKISAGNGDDYTLNNYFFDIDNAVDADTVYDLVADRKTARADYLLSLTGTQDIYTAWNVDVDPLAMYKNGVTPVQPGPDVEPVGVNPVAGTVLTPVLFEFNESFIRDDMKPGLDKVVSAMKRDPSLRLEITGHADSKGSDAYNMQLSEKRASAVREYFLICGIPASRLVVKGEGEVAPVAPNTRDNGEDNPAGRSQNRRVEMKFIQ